MEKMRRALEKAGILLTDESLRKMKKYQEMLLNWNARMDLTNVPAGDTVQRHFLDSLLPLGVEGLFPAGCHVIDVGSGAGFPGMPLMIVRPDMHVTLLEAQGKRCDFLRAVKEELGLEQLEIVQDRAEIAGQNAAYREQFDRATARAVAPLNLLCEYLLPFVKVGGAAVCWKGPGILEETEDGQAAAAALGGSIERIIGIGPEDTKHTLALIRKTEKTVPQYPRKNGIPAKRPLKKTKN